MKDLKCYMCGEYFSYNEKHVCPSPSTKFKDEVKQDAIELMINHYCMQKEKGTQDEKCNPQCIVCEIITNEREEQIKKFTDKHEQIQPLPYDGCNDVSSKTWETTETIYNAQWQINKKSQDDGRNDVSDKTLENLKQTMYEQDDYGMDKYKEPLKHTYNYDWMKMFQQEIADGLKYLQNELDRKQQIIEILENALKQQDWEIAEVFVHQALILLKAGGREKKV